MRAPITVQVVAEDLDHREMECLERAIRTVNGLQSEFLVRDSIRSIRLPGKRDRLREGASFDALHRRVKKDRIFAVTSRAFRANEVDPIVWTKKRASLDGEAG
jgi:hypothetical protein